MGCIKFIIRIGIYIKEIKSGFISYFTLAVTCDWHGLNGKFIRVIRFIVLIYIYTINKNMYKKYLWFSASFCTFSWEDLDLNGQILI